MRAGEGIDGVTVKLFNVGDAVTGAAVATATTSGGGKWNITGLSSGYYFVHLPAANFTTGGALNGATSKTGVSLADNVDHGIDDAAPSTNGISSNPFTLAPDSQPTDATGETGFANTDDNADDDNTNLTVDFGFNALPISRDYGDWNGSGALTTTTSSIIINSNLRLGATVDAEASITPDAGATADGADEDGVTMPASIVQGQSVTIPVSVFNNNTAGKYLQAWIDFNNDGTFDNTDLTSGGERVYNAVTTANAAQQTVNVTFTMPATASIGTQRGVRFRISDNSATTPTSSGATGEIEDYVTRICPIIIVALPSVAATAGTAYSQTVTASGGTAAYTFAINNGTLPLWSTLNASTGALSGTPNSTTTSTFTLKATDANGCVGVSPSYTISLSDASGCPGSRGYAIAIACPAVTITTASLANGVVGTTYATTTLAATTVGTGVPAQTYTWSVNPVLPAGLTLTSAGVLSGTPNVATVMTSYTFTATNQTACSGTKVLSFSTGCPVIAVTPGSLLQSTFGSAYTQASPPGASGISGTFTWSATGMPAGMTINSSTGALSVTGTTAVGLYPLTVTATSASYASCSGVWSGNWRVCPVISITAPPLPVPTVGSPYSTTIVASGGGGSYTYMASGLPVWATLSSGGVLTGTPDNTTATTFSVTATDTATTTCAVTQSYTLTPICPTITVSPTTTPLTMGTINLAYTGPTYAASTVATGARAWTYSVGSGALPAGMTINAATGVLDGTATVTGLFTFTIRGTDQYGCFGQTGSLTLRICPAMTIAPATLPAPVVGLVYTQTLTQSGSTATPITFSASGLPAWLSLVPSTGVISGTPTNTTPVTFTITATDANGCAVAKTYTSLTPVCPNLRATRTKGIDLLAAGFTNAGISAVSGQTVNNIGSLLSIPELVGVNLTVKAATTAPLYVKADLSTYPPFDIAGAGGTMWLGQGTGTAANRRTMVTYTFSVPVGVIMYFGSAIQNGELDSFGPAANGSIITTHPDPEYTLTDDSVYNPTATGVASVGGSFYWASSTPTTSYTATLENTTGWSNGNHGLDVDLSSIASGPPLYTSGSLPNGTQDSVYPTTQLFATGGTAPYNWSLIGTLPTGLVLNNAVTATMATIAGTPTVVESRTFTLRITDANGCTKDTSESGLVGAVVTLYRSGADNLVNTADDTIVGSSYTTIAGGAYSFTNLPPANYFVKVVPPATHLLTSGSATVLDNRIDNDNNGMQNGGLGQPVYSPIINLADTAEPTTDGDSDANTDGDSDANTDWTIDFGFWTGFTIGNLVWNDINNDGSATAETGINGLTVALMTRGSDNIAYTADDVSVTSTTTATNGFAGWYGFQVYTPGAYYVKVTPNAPYSIPSSIFTNSDTGIDNDNNGIAQPGLAGTAVNSSTFTLTLTPCVEPGTASSSNLETTIDIGLQSTVCIGNLVFKDVNHDGFYTAATAPPLDEVTLQLFTSGADPQTATPVATTTSAGGGLYNFCVLPGSYFIHVPASMFHAGTPMENMKPTLSLPDGNVPPVDDDGDQNVLATPKPFLTGVNTGTFTLAIGSSPTNATGESGTANTSDDAYDNNANLTIDLGFVLLTSGTSAAGNVVSRTFDSTATSSSAATATASVDTTDTTDTASANSAAPQTFIAWQEVHPLDGNNAANDNPDADLYPNLLEYALGTEPASAANISAQPFRLEATTNGSIEAILIRPTAGHLDLSYALQISPDQTSNWQPISQPPAITQNNDGTETLRWSLTVKDKLFARITGTLDADHNGKAEATASTPAQAAAHLPFAAATQTFSMPLLQPDVFTGRLSEATDISFTKGQSYYAVALEGSHKGETANISTADQADLSTFAARVFEAASTRVSIHAHWTLSGLFPAASFQASNSASSADRILFFDSKTNAYEVHWLYAATTGPRWVRERDTSLTDSGNRVIGANEGLLVARRTTSKPSLLTLPYTGQDRSAPFVIKLSAGTQLIGTGSLMAQSPAQCDMNSVHGFTASEDTKTASSIRLWVGDKQLGSSAYELYFYQETADTGTHWFKSESTSSADDAPLLEPLRAAFITRRVTP